MDATIANPSGRTTLDAAWMTEIDSILQARLARDPELRRLAELVAVWLASCAARASFSAPEGAAETPAPTRDSSADAHVPVVEQVAGVPDSGALVDGEVQEVEARSPAEPGVQPPDAAQLAQLLERFGNPVVSPILSVSVRPGVSVPIEPRTRTVDELEPYARRMELKADACAWATRRHDEALAGNGFEMVKEGYDELRSRAGTMQPCFLWMIHHDTQFIDREDWVRLEGCYRACAEVLRAIVEFPQAYQAGPELLRLLGETQSAIRAGMTACGAFPKWHDVDQQQVFDLCRTEGDSKQLYNVFLGLDSLADPSLHGGMLARARKAHENLKTRQQSVRDRRRGLNTIRYHIEQLQDGAENTDHHWSRVAQGIDEALASGAPPSLPELVELIMPVADDVPDDICEKPGVMQVFRFVDQRLAADEAKQQQATLPPRQATPEVLAVREALRGTRAVLIGGDQRPYSKELLEREFELAELAWQDAEEHESISVFEAAIARPETKLVVLMIRWSSHSFEGVQEMCRKHGKAFVRLPGGYNPAQVAHQIVEQVSEQLGIPARTS